MTPTSTTFPAAQAIRSLWEKHRPAVLDQVGVIEAALAAVMTGSLDETLYADARREAHKLAGSLGTFGFQRASQLAREAELALEDRAALASGSAAAVAEALLELRADLQNEPQADPGAGLPPTSGPTPLVLVVDDDEAMSGALAAEAVRRGMRAVTAASPQAGAAAIARERPDVVLLDLMFPDGVAGAYALLSDLASMTRPIPVIALTVSDAFADRVEVARRGGAGFVQKASGAETAIEAVAHLVERVGREAIRVLAVDDDQATLDTLSALLSPHGVQLTTLNDPRRLWETLEETAPDLIMLDFDMPDLSGLEQCRVLRNDGRWRGVPVLFLTARTDAESVQRVFAAGADDFVSKPVVGPELFMRIANRVERTRGYRALAERDGLTGIANRRGASDLLDQLVRLADRYDQPFGLATLDLDRFKDVNDTFGHAAGDAVLARVGQILQRTFRGEDVVARWGGEEFLIGMYGMTRQDGVRRLGEVLETVREERFRGNHASFGVTFSAGVAQYPDDGADLQSLLRAADDALYVAKHSGRATVTPACRLPGADAEPVDVAVVEDDDMLAELLQHALAGEGYRTCRIASGDRAAAALGGPAPEIPARAILLDVDLPGLDGLTVLRRLAGEGTLRRTRVIMLTARSAESEIVEALELGAVDHVAKPFSMPVLVRKLRQALTRR